jgi:hypothetical protein
VAADDERDLRQRRAYFRREDDDVLRFERVHRGNAYQRWTLTQIVLQRTPEPQVHECDLMPARLERRSDVFHPERLDAEERPETEPLVLGHRTQQQDAHARSVT